MKRFAQILSGGFLVLLGAVPVAAVVRLETGRRQLELVSAGSAIVALAALGAAVWFGRRGWRLLQSERFEARPSGGAVAGIVGALGGGLAVGFTALIVLNIFVPYIQLAARAGMAVRPLRITGAVKDAQTGQPIAGLTITPGSPFADYYSWEQTAKMTSTAGPLDHYELVLRQPLQRVTNSEGTLEAIVLRFSAPGYETNVSTAFRQMAGAVSFDVKMRRAKSLRGRVVDVDGQPVAGADVVVLSSISARNVSLHGTEVSSTQGDRIAADPAGGFQLDRPTGDFHLLIADRRGFGSVAGDAATGEVTIVLQPWVRLEGQWLAPGRAKNVQLLWCSAGQDWGVEITTDPASLDADGRFVIAKIPPGSFSLHWQARRAPDAPRWPLPLATGVAVAGQTLHLECSTDYRPVQGVIVREGSLPGIKFTQCRVSLSPMQDIRPPEHEEADTPEKTAAWWAAWSKTEEGRAFTTLSGNRRDIEVQADGRFACAVVAPGKYWLSGDWREGHHQFGRLQTRPVEIPRGDSPFDLGEFRVEEAGPGYLERGAKAPDFAVPGVEGPGVALEKRPGKFVLVDFWATDCGPCLAEMPQLRALHEKYRNDTRFAMISLDLDADPAKAQRYIQSHGMEWAQGHLAGGFKHPVTSAYGITGIPAIFLVGPDGKIIERDLRGKDMEAAITAALGH